MLTLYDGRSELWQWDTGRTLAVDADCSQVHFSNKVFGRSIDVDVSDGVAIIPDILLQTDKDLNVWAFVGTAENGYTKISKTFKVNRRNKPADYVFTPQEQILLKDAIAILEEAKDVANRAMATAKKAEASADNAAKIADEMKKLADQVEKNTETATKAKADALTAQTKAEDARNAAETAKKAAEEAANSAGTDASAASAAATRAQNAANNASASLASIQVLYQEMQEYVSHSIQNIQTEGDTQVQRVSEEGTAQISAAKEQADRAQSEADRAEAARSDAEETVENCIPDDTAVDGKPWTSKKIVDSLCMPFSETGNPVQVYPVEGYPLRVKVSWEPTQKGKGDPSPDNIRPITGRDTVSVTRCGKNLVEHAYSPGYTVTRNGVTFTVNDDYSVTAKGTAAEDTYFNFIYIKSEDLITNYIINAIGRTVVHNEFEIRDIVVQPYPRDHNTRLYLVTPKGAVVDTTYYPTIVYGSTATPYEPYTGDTYDISLPETVYGGEVGAVTGEGQETWKTLTLDGTEEWKYESDSYFVGHNILNNLPTEIDGKCSHFIYSFNFAGNCIFCTGDSVYTGPKLTSKYTDVAAWKAYLAAQYAAGTPVQICYKLAEPVPFTATGTQPIPALSGVNTVLTDADGVIVTGAEDPKHTITELKNAIISLGGNV